MIEISSKSDAIAMADKLCTEKNNLKAAVDSIKPKLLSVSGEDDIDPIPLAKNIVKALDETVESLDTVSKNVTDFISKIEQVDEYENETEAEESTTSGNTESSGEYKEFYHNNEEAGFVVTTGNKKYEMSDSSYDFVCALVSAESDQTYDDALGVVSTILNRCEDEKWVSTGHGTDPVHQISGNGAGQYSCYDSGSYERYLHGKSPETVAKAVRDAMYNGVRNNNYTSYRANTCTKYSDKMISPTGNRYGFK